jgi:hypothetical protein
MENGKIRRKKGSSNTKYVKMEVKWIKYMQKGKTHRISFTADLKKDINMENVLIA